VALDHALLGEDEPALGDAGFGIDAELEAIEGRATHADFDDEGGGARVGVKVVGPRPANDGDIGLGLGIGAEGVAGASIPPRSR